MTSSFSRLSRAALACLLGASLASAQGADDCSSAQPISGTGFFNFSIPSGTNTDGHPEGLYSTPGVGQIYSDRWYSWVAPTTGAYEISTDHDAQNNPSGIWSCIAVYRYGCATGQGRALSARAPVTGVYSTLSLGAEAGETYLIRIGLVNNTLTGSGVFSITPTSLPGILGTTVNPANGRTYHILEPSSWHVAQAAALELGGNLVTVNDQAEQDWLQQTFHDWGGQARDFWIGYNDAETEGNWVWASGETPGYENWSSPPNNGNEYEHYAHFRRDHLNGTWNDLIGDPNGGFFYDEVHGVVEVGGGVGTALCFGDGTGTACPCGNFGSTGEGCANSTGAGALLSSDGSASVGADDVTFTVTQGPSGVPGIVFTGTAQQNGGLGAIFGDGLLCAGGTIQRLDVVFLDGSGAGTWGPGLQPLGGWSAGDTRYVQGWYRNTNGSPCAGNFNTTQALEVVFEP